MLTYKQTNYNQIHTSYYLVQALGGSTLSLLIPRNSQISPMRTITSLLFTISIVFTSSAQEIIPISSIPDSLKENANAVYILNKGSFDITNDSRAIYKTHQIIAILNPKAEWMARKTLWYDKFSKVNYLKGNKYDASGKFIEKLRKSDIIDQSSYDGFSVFTDSRLKNADLRQTSYPFIVEFEYETEFKYTYYIPDWQVLPRQNVSVIQSIYKITAPQEYEPRIKISNTDKDISRRVQDGIVYMGIEFNNFKAKERESYGPDFDELTPIVKCAPSKFNYDGYKGDMSTWNNYSKWQMSLNKGKDDLSEEAIQEIKAHIENISNREEKIKAVYEFVQNKTRYVSIQLGIGGWQPFPASDVDKLGYGDCKALSNYTYSLLKAVGIASNYTKVYGGDNPPDIDVNFPDNSFNHIILCVPNEQDTIWLECTSQTNPFGYVGDFTGDRDVFVINESGGKIVHTTVYDKESNTQIGKASVTLAENGTTKAVIQIKYAGLQSENSNINFNLHNTKKEQEKWIYKYTGISNFEIVDFNFEIEKNKIPVVTENLNVFIRDFSSLKGNRLFFTPNLMNRWDSSPKRYKDRQTDVVRKFTGVDIDSITYTLPEKYKVEFLFEAINIESQFGKYTASVSFEDDKLLYVRRLELNKGRFPKEDYDEFRNFYRSIVKADKTKVVFVNGT